MNYGKEGGLRLKKALKDKRLKLIDLSSMTQGYSISRISNYVQGTRRMKQEDAVIFASLLGVSASYLLCLDDSMILSDDEKHLIHDYRENPTDNKDALRTMARTGSRLDSKNKVSSQ